MYQYLTKLHKPHAVCHIWTGEHTLCPTSRIRGFRLKEYDIVDDIADRRLCNQCIERKGDDDNA